MSLLPHALSQDISLRLGRAVARTGLTPNMLTIGGLYGMGAAATLAAFGHFWQAGLVMFGAAFLDLLDGAVARASGQASDWGAVLDAVADRISEFGMLIALIVWYSDPDRFDRTAIILLAVAIHGGILVSYTRSKAAEFGVQIRSGLGTRLERVLILGIGLLSGQIVPVLWLLAVLTNLTALQRWIVTWLAMREFERSGVIANRLAATADTTHAIGPASPQPPPSQPAPSPPTESAPDGD